MHCGPLTDDPSPPGQKSLPHAVWLFLSLLILLVGTISSVHGQGNGPLAQAQPSAYWQYDAPSPLGLVAVGDVDYDGIDEFVVTTADGQVILLRASGQDLWTYQAPERTIITRLAILNTDGPQNPEQEILLATQDGLILLDQHKQVLWEKPLDLPPIPTSLLTASDEEVRQREQRSIPVALLPFDREQDGNEEILILLQSGLLQLYDTQGALLWQYPDSTTISDDPLPQVRVGDVDGDGQDEILFSYFVGYTKVALLDGDGHLVWKQERALSGRPTALALVPFDSQGTLEIALGISFRSRDQVRERVILLDADGIEQWYRTPNRLITSLSTVQLPEGPALAVGTEVGTITLYNRYGRLLWRYLPENARRSVIALSQNPNVAYEDQVALALTLSAGSSRSGTPADVLLLNNSGQRVQSFLSASGSGETRLVDVNRDGISELLLASFGTLSLLDPGTGARKNAPAWDQRLSSPQTTLVRDIDKDGQDELLVGGLDGFLTGLEGNTGQLGLHLPLGGEVSHLALTPADANELPFIVVAHSNPPDQTAVNRSEGWIEVVQPTGRNVWQQPKVIQGEVTGLVVGNINRDIETEIVVSTDRGRVFAYSMGGRELWQTTVPGRVEHLLLADSDGDGRSEVIAGTSGSVLYRFGGQGEGDILASYNPLALEHLWALSNNSGTSGFLLLAANDGSLRVLDNQGTELWLWQVPEGSIAQAEPAGDDKFLVASSAGTLFLLDTQQQQLVWEEPGFGQVTALYWGDLDGGSSEDLAIGTRNADNSGTVYLYTSEKRLWDTLQLTSGVFRLDGLHLSPDQQAQLVVLTENGVIQLFAARPNRPPLLVNPQVEVGPGQYIVRVLVLEEEADEVVVGLQTFEPGTRRWLPVEEKRIRGRDTFVASVAQAATGNIHYRFVFDDGTHQGMVEPPAGPTPQPVGALRNPLMVPAVIFLGLLSVLIIVRQSFSSEARAGRVYNRLKQQPTLTLSQFSAEYARTAGSPNFLLSLANRARSDNNHALANLADGAFLLPTRPNAALPIINNALRLAGDRPVPWHSRDVWLESFEMGQALLEAPTITELSLLRPQLMQMSQGQEAARQRPISLEPFVRVLTSLRDSERVDLAEDRIVYLHEASIILRQIEDRVAELPVTLESQLLDAVLQRCIGLANAEVEMLRGQAQLVATLKTRRVVPEDGKVLIALEITNQGRAAAEKIVVSVEDDPAYSSHSAPQMMPVLSPGRSHEIQFRLAPHVNDRFRAAFKMRYDDRIGTSRYLAFADMVHLLPPVREFSPIVNPYTPGTPLRGNSPLFYGREDLFQFIVENVGRTMGRNVLMLVGQRRSGKTSALLRLDQHLPDDVWPVYVDCQSLGVLPGMASLLYDLAWLITDALAPRGYEIEVPDPVSWRDDPAGQFQRRFLPAVQEQLPAGTTLLLVFDEFEAFENLVADGILPSTFFTFMRHLMQHSEGVGFVFVGTHRLEEMSSDYWSILFNIALYREIGFLSREAALRLIQEPAAPHIVYDDLALDKIWRVTAGHPYFLQLVCYTLVKRANQMGTGYVTISDVNAALEEMLRLGEVHFAYIWQRSTYTERALLTAVAHLMDRDVPFHPSDLIQYLEQYGFRLDPAEVTAGLTHLVEREIMREVTEEGTTLYELKIGLVGLWAAQNKSLSKLYESRNGSSTPQTVRPEKV